ncbi:MAG: CBS domain-containing protein [Chloroflexales bacterium]|nr:CBS domain-containing protein [Chloroflexales bacterium]
MVEYEVSSMVVVDNDNYLVGIITRADVLRAYLEHDDWETLTVERYMHCEVEIVTPHTPLIEAARMLVDHQARQVVVVEEEGGKQRPVAIISATDLVYHMLKD